MGRTKKQKAAAAKDEPGPDDYIFLAVFFPVGRSGAALAREDDPNDYKAAQRIGRWMHEAGLPIRKLFSRKSVEHIIVEVRKEIPEEVIDSKLGAYKWVDTIVDISKIPPDYIHCETTILRARVRSHDAVEKMGGMVYFPVEPIVPTGPRSESPFKSPFPRPKRVGYREPSTFSAIQYYPLPPEFTVVEEFDAQPDVKPDIKPQVNPDVKPDVSRDPSQASNSSETKAKPEADVQPKSEEPLRPNHDMNPERSEQKKSVKTEAQESETKPKVEEPVRPNWDMNPSAEERQEQERLRIKHEESIVRPNWDMNPSAEERVEQERRRVEFEGQGRPEQPSPSTEQNGAPPGKNTPREPENLPRVKTEPQQPPVVKKRPAENGDGQERGVKRERLG
ncbi:hypothetical protein RSOL_423520 [Rhizoctonia solani AG-3 Rhs1AP]|uniref:Uncharacterized protein n=1 Tax=Rhizoctonia solani AG-3 Rhs1AP TaxID=1086054 RepID=X8JH14_9AGAM|nr:hypothetical protein RSOL_423520 [Rhizoctonia solani AG-3 Rhs1AP]